MSQQLHENWNKSSFLVNKTNQVIFSWYSINSEYPYMRPGYHHNHKYESNDANFICEMQMYVKYFEAGGVKFSTGQAISAFHDAGKR